MHCLSINYHNISNTSLFKTRDPEVQSWKDKTRTGSASDDVFGHPGHPGLDVLVHRATIIKVNSFFAKLRQKLSALKALPGTVGSVSVR